PITRPRPSKILAPKLERRSVNNGCRLAHAVSLGDIDGVSVAIPHQLDRRERVIPAEIHAANARPMPGKLAMLNRERLFRYRKDAARAKRRDAFGACLAFMRRIARDDFGL